MPAHEKGPIMLIALIYSANHPTTDSLRGEGEAPLYGRSDGGKGRSPGGRKLT
jgi:hypothetical protein